jgi:hypothetical protein
VIESRTWRLFVILTSLGILGGLVLAFSLRWGAGLSPDSILYIAAARNLLAGRGFSSSFDSEQFSPLTHYPPLYPALLAGVGQFGIDPVDGARWLNAVLFAANIALAGSLVYLSVRSFWPVVVAALLFMTAHPITQIHSMAWSEPLFLTFELLEIIFLAAYLERPRFAALVSASLVAALAFLSRYGGATVVATGAIAILLLNRIGWKRRLADTLVFASLSCLPIAVWMIRNYLMTGSTTNRVLSFHPQPLSTVSDVLTSVSGWFLPLAESGPLRLIAALLIVIPSICIYFIARARFLNPTEASYRVTDVDSLLTLFSACYGILLFFSLSFFDAGIPIDSRILSPFYPALLVLGVAGWARFPVQKTRQFSIRFAGVALGTIVFLSQSAGAWSWLNFSYLNGVGFASREWRESPLVNRVRNMDGSVPVYSNAAEVVYLFAVLPAVLLPAKVNPQTRLPNGGYRTDLAVLHKELRRRHGVLVYFSNVRWRWYLATEAELVRDLGLRLVARERDGAIYKAGFGE